MGRKYRLIKYHWSGRPVPVRIMVAEAGIELGRNLFRAKKSNHYENALPVFQLSSFDSDIQLLDQLLGN